MCANVSQQVQDKAKFIAEKVTFLEKCETEMQGILDGFDEQINQLFEIDQFTKAQIKKIQTTQHIYGFNSIFDAQEEQIRAE